jgi:hypothetical protein
MLTLRLGRLGAGMSLLLPALSFAQTATDPATSGDVQALTAAINAHASMISSLFAIPSADELSALFGIGLISPLIAFTTAWAVGVLVNFWRS